MAKLVDSAVTVRPFIPKLLPGLIKVETTIGDPEARGVVGRAIATLRQVGEIPADSDGTELPPLKQADEKHLAHSLISIYKKAGAQAPSAGSIDVMYAANLAANLVNAKNFDLSEWQALAPYLAFLTTSPPSFHLFHLFHHHQHHHLAIVLAVVRNGHTTSSIVPLEDEPDATASGAASISLSHEQQTCGSVGLRLQFRACGFLLVLEERRGRYQHSSSYPV